MVKREIAERFAATAVECVTVEQARAIIAEFLGQVARCPVCDGSGTFTFGRKTRLDVRNNHGDPVGSDGRFIPEGTTGSCPRCGDGVGDPDVVVWHCFDGCDLSQCQAMQGKGDANSVPHERCGYRIMLPLPKIGP